MNKVILMGRLVKDPEIRYTQAQETTAIANFRLAVDRRFKRQGDEQTADFISCTAFARQADFMEKYCRKGIKLAVTGRIQTGSYTNKDGQKVYTTDVIVEEIEFAESKAASEANQSRQAQPQQAPNPAGASAAGFMEVPGGSYVEDLPFN